jgi:hypothetical protein
LDDREVGRSCSARREKDGQVRNASLLLLCRLVRVEYAPYTRTTAQSRSTCTSDRLCPAQRLQSRSRNGMQPTKNREKSRLLKTTTKLHTSIQPLTTTFREKEIAQHASPPVCVTNDISPRRICRLQPSQPFLAFSHLLSYWRQSAVPEPDPKERCYLPLPPSQPSSALPVITTLR